MSEERVVQPEELAEEEQFEVSLRPRRLAEFVGQAALKENLELILGGARARGELPDHILLYGPPGLGKTTLAAILANEMETPLRATAGPAIEHQGALASILSNLEGGVLFIDEIHRLSGAVEELLYPAMEDFAIDVVTGKGFGAMPLHLELPRFTIIGATTRQGMLSSPLRDRFGAVFRIDYYGPEEVREIVLRSARILGVEIDPEAAELLAGRSRGTPRIANRLLRRARDWAQVRGTGRIDAAAVVATMELLAVDEVGLDDLDRRILRTIVESYGGGPVGIDTLAVSLSEERETLEDVFEPYLIQLGFLARTPRGRVATVSAYRHLGLTPPPTAAAAQQPDLFG